MKTVEGDGFPNGEESDRHVEEVAVTRLRRVSNAEVRCLGKQGPSRRKGPAGARAESEDSLPLSLPLGAHVLPSAHLPGLRAGVQSLSVWMLRAPRGLQSSLWPGVQESGQRGLQPGLTNPGSRIGGPGQGTEDRWDLRAGRKDSWRCLALCLCTHGQAEEREATCQSHTGAQPGRPTAWTATPVVPSQEEG